MTQVYHNREGNLQFSCQKVTMDIQVQRRVHDAYEELGRLCEKDCKDKYAVLEITFPVRRGEEEKRTVSFLMQKGALYVIGHVDGDGYAVIWNKTNYNQFQSPGYMTLDTVIAALNRAWESHTPEELLDVREGEAYGVYVVLLIFLVSEAVRMETSREAAMDILFRDSRTTFFLQDPQGSKVHYLANWNCHVFLLQNWMHLAEQYEKGIYKKPVTRAAIRDFYYREVFPKEQKSTDHVIRDNLMAVGVPL